MVHHFPNLFLRIFILSMFLRYDIADQFMVPFTVALLICIHRITIEYAALNFPGLHICFDFLGIAKFTSPIGNNNLEKYPKLFVSKCFPQPTEYFRYRSCCIAFSQKHELQVTVGKQDCQQCLASFVYDHTVHLADHGIWILVHIFLVFFITASDMAFPVYPENRAALFPFRPAQFPSQVYISGIQKTCINIGIDCPFRYWQFISVTFTDNRE